MEETLISFETAKLAKKKGFNPYSVSGYHYNNDGIIYHSGMNLERNPQAPTQSLLQKWLREEHNSIVEIVYSKQDYTSPIKFESTVDYFTKELEYEITIDPEFRSKKFLKYEDALEIGLFNALKLIK